MNLLDLFSGIGGFALGARWAGYKFEKTFFSEINPYCIANYAGNFPGSIYVGDITTLAPEKLPREDWIVTGGFPCQNISVAGRGEGIRGEKSGLWFYIPPILRILRPRVCIFENVGAITVRGLDAVLSSLAEIGYDAEWTDIRASDVGAPHRRERIWIVAYPSNDRTRWRKQFEERGEETRDVDLSYSSRERFEAERLQVGNGARLSKSTCSSWWISEPGIRRVVNGLPPRVYRVEGLGNSIVPEIAEILFAQIRMSLDEAIA